LTGTQKGAMLLTQTQPDTQLKRTLALLIQ
jgi:hypothetical protein